MTKREYTKTIEVTNFEIICDVCGHTQRNSMRGFGECAFCEKQVCYKHYAYSEDESGDYPTYVRACPEHEQKLKAIIEYYKERSNYPSLEEMIEQQRKMDNIERNKHE